MSQSELDPYPRYFKSPKEAYCSILGLSEMPKDTSGLPERINLSALVSGLTQALKDGLEDARERYWFINIEDGKITINEPQVGISGGISASEGLKMTAKSFVNIMPSDRLAFCHIHDRVDDKGFYSDTDLISFKCFRDRGYIALLGTSSGYWALLSTVASRKIPFFAFYKAMQIVQFYEENVFFKSKFVEFLSSLDIGAYYANFKDASKPFENDPSVFTKFEESNAEEIIDQMFYNRKNLRMMK